MPENAEELEALSAYLDGELPEPQRRQVEALLRESASARGLLEELRGVRRRVAGLPREAAGSRFTEGVLARLERESLLGAAREGAGQAQPASAWGQGWAIAAGFVLMIGAGGLYWLLPRGGSTATSLLRERDVIQLADGELSSAQTASESSASLKNAEPATASGQLKRMPSAPKGLESTAASQLARVESPEPLSQAQTGEPPLMPVAEDARDAGRSAAAAPHDAPNVSPLESNEAAAPIQTLVVSVDGPARGRMQARIVRAGPWPDETRNDALARDPDCKDEAQVTEFEWTGEASEATGLLEDLSAIDAQLDAGARWTLDGTPVRDARAVRMTLALDHRDGDEKVPAARSGGDAALEAAAESPSSQPGSSPAVRGDVPASQSARTLRLRIRIEPVSTSQPTSREADHE